MSNVHTFAEERAARAQPDLEALDEDMAAGVSEEMRAALAAAPDLAEPAAAVPRPAAGGRSPLQAQWARFRADFVDALEGGLHRVEDLEAMLARGEAYFWPGRECAVVAQRVTYPSGETVMQVLWAVGDLEEVLTLAPGIEATARLVGCSSMLVEGRSGWARILKPHGYEPWSVTVRKAL